jgi:hypothetical protein
MSGKGNCYDNAMVETVFKTIKSELVWRTIFQTRAAAEWALGRYIASTSQFDDIPLWDTNRRHHSRPQWPSQSESLSTKPGQVQSLSSAHIPSAQPHSKISSGNLAA